MRSAIRRRRLYANNDGGLPYQILYCCVAALTFLILSPLEHLKGAAISYSTHFEFSCTAAACDTTKGIENEKE